MKTGIVTWLLLGLKQTNLATSENEHGRTKGNDVTNYDKNEVAGKYYICQKKVNISNTNRINSNEDIKKKVGLVENELGELFPDGIFKKLDIEDWNSLSKIIKEHAILAQGQFVMDLKDFQLIFNKMVNSYSVDVNLINFKEDILKSVKNSQLNKNIQIIWKGQMNFNSIELPENANLLLIMEKSNNTYLTEHDSIIKDLVINFIEIKEFIKKNPNDSVTIDLKHYPSFDKTNLKSLGDFKIFTTKLVNDLGSTAPPFFDLDGTLDLLIFGFLLDNEFLNKTDKEYLAFKIDLTTHLKNTIVDSKLQEISFRRFEKYQFNSKTLIKLNDTINKLLQDKAQEILYRLDPKWHPDTEAYDIINGDV